jgi:hypothetical protein
MRAYLALASSIAAIVGIETLAGMAWAQELQLNWPARLAGATTLQVRPTSGFGGYTTVAARST